MKLVVLLGLAASAALAGDQPQTLPAATALSGRAVFVGELPAGVGGTAKLDGEKPATEPLKIDAEKSKGCTKDGSPVNPENQTLLVSKDGGVANVVIQVMVEGAKLKEAPETFHIDQKQCRFDPHVKVLPVGSTLEFLNSDDVSHNIHTYPKKNETINKIVAAGSKEQQKLEKADEIKIACDLHPWMAAYVIVTDTPHHAVTDAEGKFKIEGLPAGEHNVEYWHETLGKGKTKITVKEDGTAEPLELWLSTRRAAGRGRR